MIVSLFDQMINLRVTAQPIGESSSDQGGRGWASLHGLRKNSSNMLKDGPNRVDRGRAEKRVGVNECEVTCRRLSSAENVVRLSQGTMAQRMSAVPNCSSAMRTNQ